MKAVIRIAPWTVVALVFLSGGPARSQRPVSIDTPQSAFRSIGATGAEGRNAARSLLRHSGLDWRVDSFETPYTHDDVWAVASHSRAFAILCGARAGAKTEGFPVGPARYALLDSTGTPLWTRSDAPFLDLPAVSDQGVTALLMPDGAGGRGRMDRLRVEFVGPDGRHLGAAAWGDRIWGSSIFVCRDTYGFSPHGVFCIALNQASSGASSDSLRKRDRSTVYLIASDGKLAGSHTVGDLRVRQLLFSPGGHVAFLATQGELHFRGEPALRRIIGLLDERGTLLAQHEVPDAEQAMLDPVSDSLFSFSPERGVIAIDMRTGGLDTTNALARLESLGQAEDEAVSGSAARILDAVRSRRHVHVKPDAIRARSE